MKVVYRMATFSPFSEVSEEVLKHYWIIQFPRKRKGGNSPLHELKTLKLLNKLMNVSSQLKVSNENSVRARDFAKA